MMVVDEDARPVERQGAEGAEAAILPIQRQGERLVVKLEQGRPRGWRRRGVASAPKLHQS